MYALLPASDVYSPYMTDQTEPQWYKAERFDYCESYFQDLEKKKEERADRIAKFFRSLF